VQIFIKLKISSQTQYGTAVIEGIATTVVMAIPKTSLWNIFALNAAKRANGWEALFFDPETVTNSQSLRSG
jgi:hypothetical protein